MRTIHKYQLRLDVDEMAFAVPLGAKPLSVGLQNQIPYLWCEVETENREVSMEIHIYATGQEIDKKRWLEFIGRYTLTDGTEWHVFAAK